MFLGYCQSSYISSAHFLLEGYEFQNTQWICVPLFVLWTNEKEQIRLPGLGLGEEGGSDLHPSTCPRFIDSIAPSRDRASCG